MQKLQNGGNRNKVWQRIALVGDLERMEIQRVEAALSGPRTECCQEHGVGVGITGAARQGIGAPPNTFCEAASDSSLEGEG